MSNHPISAAKATATGHLSANRRRMFPGVSCRAVCSDCGETYSDDELAFMLAMDRYNRDNRRPFPTWSEVMGVFLSLGYRKGA